MTIERRNPVPPGRYWVDAIDVPADAGSALPGLAESQIDRFRRWLKANGASVSVEKLEVFDGFFMGLTWVPKREWYLFRVLSPVPWEGPGLPTIAPPEITSSEDTANVPPPAPSAVEEFGAQAARATQGFLFTLGAGVAAIVLFNVLTRGKS